MRLINTETLKLHSFLHAQIPKYAILSHTWGDDEVNLQQYERCTSEEIRAQAKTRSGFEKIVACCEIARARDLKWAWCDTCCIDKTSSAELSEAINSMFKWYRQAAICLVFLSDLVRSPYQEVTAAALSDCRWFTRGWTLQELIAPSQVVFFDWGLQRIGTKASLVEILSYITGIDKAYLSIPGGFRKACIAERMSWASKRTTAREEDMAYCLLGVFDINMPLLYGEGKKAFLRLQQQIVAQSRDESIFAWQAKRQGSWSGIFAEWPHDFERSNDVRRIWSYVDKEPCAITNRGLRMHVQGKEWLSKWGRQRTLVVKLDCARLLQGRHVRVAIELCLVDKGFRETCWCRKSPGELIIRDSRFRIINGIDELAVGTTAIEVAQTTHELDAASPVLIDDYATFILVTSLIAVLILETVIVKLSGGTLLRGSPEKFPPNGIWTCYYLMLGLYFFPNRYWFFFILHLSLRFGIVYPLREVLVRLETLLAWALYMKLAYFIFGFVDRRS